MRKKRALQRRFCALCAAVLLLCTGCSTTQGAGGGSGMDSGSGMGGGDVSGETAPLSIVATIFPLWDWTRQILGERAEKVELTLLLDGATDLHSYQPTVNDMAVLSACDLFLYVGGESDNWVADALSSSPNPDRRALNLLEILGEGAKQEELVEGMEAEPDAGEEEPAADEHIWLSLKNARILCGAIAGTLMQLDPEGAEVYTRNLDLYLAQIDALDREYREAVDAAPRKVLLFGDRFPFRYLVDDYGLDYYAAFAGCSAETEASFETVVFLAGKVDELHLPAVLTLEGGNAQLARTIVASSAAKDAVVLRLDSMQSASARDGDTTWLSVMGNNLIVLREALK